MAKTNTQTALISSQSLAAAAAAVRAALDCSGKDGGQITFRITNGATAPTAQAVATLMVAHSNTTPARSATSFLERGPAVGLRAATGDACRRGS